MPTGEAYFSEHLNLSYLRIAYNLCPNIEVNFKIFSSENLSVILFLLLKTCEVNFILLDNDNQSELWPNDLFNVTQKNKKKDLTISGSNPKEIEPRR